MTTIHGDYVGKTLIFSPYIAHIFSVPHKETSTLIGKFVCGKDKFIEEALTEYKKV